MLEYLTKPHPCSLNEWNRIRVHDEMFVHLLVQAFRQGLLEQMFVRECTSIAYSLCQPNMGSCDTSRSRRCVLCQLANVSSVVQTFEYVYFATHGRDLYTQLELELSKSGYECIL
jgi:hypothetical protein